MGITTGKLSPTTNIPQMNSKADEWIQWHKTLKAQFGRKVANGLWMKAWARRGSSSVNTSDLRDYMSKQGIKLDSSAWDKVVDAGGDFLDTIGDSLQMTKYVTIGVLVIIVGGLGIAIFNIAKNPAQSIGTAAKAMI